jgi:nucleoid DNA-binding protein
MDENGPVTKRELHDALGEAKRELHQAIHQAVKEVTDSMTELIRDTETKMLTAFHGYAKGTAARIQRTEISESANAARIEALESRVLELETRTGS